MQPNRATGNLTVRRGAGSTPLQDSCRLGHQRRTASHILLSRQTGRVPAQRHQRRLGQPQGLCLAGSSTMARVTPRLWAGAYCRGVLQGVGPIQMLLYSAMGAREKL